MVMDTMSDIKAFEPLWGVWKTEKLIGEGSYGKVYRAVREEFGRKYYAAIKHISIPASESQVTEAISEGVADDNESVREYFEDIAKNLINEISLMNNVKGKTNIVSYEDHLIIPKSSGIGYDIIIRMELLTGLNDVLRHKQFTNKDVIKLGIDLCSALEVCVDKGIVHRDIKPSNIFVSDIGEYKLGDFGVARELEHTTSAMSKKGTYVYMAPEVYRGESANFSADIFSLGIVMYRLLNGNRAPFLPVSAKIKPGDNENALARRMSGESMPAPAFAEEGLAQIILKATQFDRTKRYASPTEMKNDLIRLSGGTVLERTIPIIAEPTPNSVSTQPCDKTEAQGTVFLFQDNIKASSLSDEDDQGSIIIFPEDEESENQSDSNNSRNFQRTDDKSYTVSNYSNGSDRKTAYTNSVYSKSGYGSSSQKSNQSNFVDDTEERSKKRIINIVKIAAVILIILILIAVPAILRRNRYNEYIQLYNNMDYDDARDGFDSLGDYNLSREYVKLCDYNIAKRNISNGNYDEAISILESLEGYSDSAELIKDAYYKKATALLSSGEYEDAKSFFEMLGSYSDCKSMIIECDYQKALDDYSRKEYTSARREFQALNDNHQYKKSAEYFALCDFYIAKEKTSAFSINDLNSVMDNLLKYADTNPECKKCCADSLFTILKLYNSKFSYGNMYIKIVDSKDEKHDLYMWWRDIWDANYKSWSFVENRGVYGVFTHTKNKDDDENKTYDDWFEVVGFDDPYTNKPSTVTIKNPHNDKEYTLKRQG